MRRFVFRSLSRMVSADISQQLKDNAAHRELRWNVFEKIIVWCTTNYVRAMLVLLGVAIFSVITAACLRPYLLPFAAEYLGGIKKLPDWLPNLLGGQLTITGIVFPMVVGLISVIFQKKSAREHIQSAYQLYSGYMFSGLSGLLLSAFILSGGLISSAGDKYLNVAFSVVAFIWMTLNMGLSIWFFIQSLNVLDDEKRTRIMLKYFHSRAVRQYIDKSIISNWLRYPGVQLRSTNFEVRGVNLLPYSTSQNGYDLLKIKVKNHEEIIGIYIGLLKFLLRKISPSDGAEVIVLPSYGVVDGYITILASKNIELSTAWKWMFRLCFVRKRKVTEKNYSRFTREFFGEVYDALNDNNIGVFEESADHLVTTYTQLKNSFQYGERNYIDECSGGPWSGTFSSAFHHDLIRLGREAVKTIATSGLYLRKIYELPGKIIRETTPVSQNNFDLCISTQTEVWCSLTEWRADAGDRLSVSQEHVHRELVQDFIGGFEGWLMWFHIRRSKGLPVDIYRGCLWSHLLNLPKIVLAAVEADDTFATDQSTDHINMWVRQTRINRGLQTGYHWTSFFLTPDFVTAAVNAQEGVSGEEYDDEGRLYFAFRNAVTDLRLLIAGYLLAYQKPQQRVSLADVIRRLLCAEIVYPTGSVSAEPADIRRMSDIVDIIVRFEWGISTEKLWQTSLLGLVSNLASGERKALISGRMYQGARPGLSNLYPCFVELALTLPSATPEVSRRIRGMLRENIFSLEFFNRITYRLKRLRINTADNYTGFLMEPVVYIRRATEFNELIDSYIQAISETHRNTVLNAVVDRRIFRKTDLELTSWFSGMVSENNLLALFEPKYRDDLYNNGEMLKGHHPVRKEELIQHDEGFSGSMILEDSVENTLLTHFLNKLNQLAYRQQHNVRDFHSIIPHLQSLTSDTEEYILIVCGEFRSDALCELQRRGNGRQLTDNCEFVCSTVYGEQVNCALLVSRDIFGQLGIYRYPDGTLFTTSFLESREDPLQGELITVFDVEMTFRGMGLARFESE